MSKQIFDELEKLENQLDTTSEIPKKFIFLGSENHLCENLINTYHKAIQKQETFIEKTWMNGLEASPNEFYTELFTIPLFASTRMIIVRHADLLFKQIESEKTTLKYFTYGFEHWPQSIFCFFQFDSSSIPKKMTLLSQLSITFKPSIPKRYNLIPYYTKKVKQMGYNIDQKTLELLISKCAWDFYRIQQILDQLTLHLIPQNKETSKEINITQDMIEEFCTNWDGNFYFEILDYIAEKKIQKCIQRIYQHSFDDGSELSGSFTKLFIDAYRYHHFKKLGLPNSETLERLNMKTAHPFMIKKSQQRYQKLMQHYPETSIYLVFKHLIKLDETLKIEPKGKHQTLLIMFIASLEEC